MSTELMLRRERQRRGWSITYVSGLTGISATDLSLLERGLRQAYPGWRRRIAVAYRIPEDALFAPAPPERRGNAHPPEGNARPGGPDRQRAGPRR